MEKEPSTSEGKSASVETLLDLIVRFHAECHQQRHGTPTVTLDSTLDQDLGFDSLSRMELFSRAEQHFQVVFSERVFSETETPRDLLRAIQSADTHRANQTTVQTVPTSGLAGPGEYSRQSRQSGGGAPPPRRRQPRSPPYPSLQ